MTKEKVDALLERFEKLDVGGDTVHGQDATQTDALLTSVISPSLYSTIHSIPPSALERIEDKLRDVSDRVESGGHVASNEDTKAVSELMDYIRDAVTSYQVCGGTQALCQ